MADTGVLIVFRCEFQWGGGFVARLNSLLKNAFAGREVAQVIKPNSNEMYGLDGMTKVMPCYKAMRDMFQQAVKSRPVTKHHARHFSASCRVVPCYKAPYPVFFNL